MLKGKNILIIGASGTLGQALIDELIKYDVHSIRCFSRNEHKQFLLRQKYGEPTSKMRYFLGDIRDKDALDMAMQDCHYVFNFAALKHVWACEDQAFECLKTNVIGVQNAIDCAIKRNVETFVQMSTDKAVNPINAYGCSKAMAEHLVLNAHNYQGKNRTCFLVVRSGNVLGSSGSVLEIWQRQRDQGLPLTVTDLNCTRYGASKEQIAKAILKASTCGIQGLVVLNMKRYSIKELLAQFGDCDIIETGLKPFEKMDEALFREGEKFTLMEVDER